MTSGGEKGYIVTEDVRKRQSEKTSEAMKKVYAENPEHRKKLSESHSKTLYFIQPPEEPGFWMFNMSEFCRCRGLDQGNMCSVVSGKYKQYKGYTAQRIA
jgi:hypothetical protein